MSGRWFKVIDEHADALRVSMGEPFHWTLVTDRSVDALHTEGRIVESSDTVQSRSLMIDHGKFMLILNW